MPDLLYTKIAEDIEKQIKAGVLVEDQKLESERLMALRYGVSRNVVREALKVLNEKGLVDIRTGKGGYITLPKERDLIGKFENAIDYSQIEQSDILEAREAIDKIVGRRAIERASKADIRILRNIYSQLEECIDDKIAFGKLDTVFHYELAKCSENEVLVLITSTLNKLSDREWFYIKGGSITLRLGAQSEHKAMIDAIESKSINEFESAIERHLEFIKKRRRIINQ